jgi:hypothetical protein
MKVGSQPQANSSEDPVSKYTAQNAGGVAKSDI